MRYREQMDDDYRKFCMKCAWNDADLGCTSPRGEEIWQCPMYIHYHPEEVKEFDKTMGEIYKNWKAGDGV